MTSSTSSLAGARVVVIGGSSGIGKAVAARAAGAGARVHIGSRSADRLAQAAKEIDGATTGVVDVRDEESLRAFFATVDGLDHLVVCPGDMAVGSVYEVSLDHVRAALDTKIVGQLLTVRHAGKKITPGGSVTLIAGAAGFKAYPDMSATAAANAGIAGMGRSLALELAPIRVNVVVGGLIDTPLWSFLPDDAREGLFAQTAQSSPVARVGRPDDVAVSVQHLMENTFVTGAVVHVDGGGTL
ncbi:SDR family oxidoreductase [Streptomyces avicenniae]|uniref:SDR family oxidoreductase n=1 Tax=Streptomyces avicenniae TaxID=500153 RepID=UPI00069ADA1C|nr:SDR family oxidoreductase [Streptomyces avicenniae]